MNRDQAERLRQLIQSKGKDIDSSSDSKAVIRVLEGFYQGEYETNLVRIDDNQMSVVTPKRNGRIIFLAEGTKVKVASDKLPTFTGSVIRRNFEGTPTLHLTIPADISAIKRKPVLLNQAKRVVVVTSGKGGVGKTTVSVNLSLALRDMGYRVTLFDADIGLANVDIMLGINPSHNLGHVLRGEKKISQVVHDEGGLHIISGGSGVPELFTLSESDVELFVSSLLELEEFTDILVVDTGAGVSPQVTKFVQAADDVLVVCTPEPTSLTDAYALIKALSNFNIQSEIMCVVNRAKSQEDARATFRKLALTADKFLGIKLRLLGYISEDAIVEKSIREQTPLIRKGPNTKAARAIRNMASSLVGNKQAGASSTGASGITGFFAKLVGYLQ